MNATDTCADMWQKLDLTIIERSYGQSKGSTYQATSVQYLTVEQFEEITIIFWLIGLKLPYNC